MGYYFTEVLVNFKGMEVKLFLFKTSKRGSWSGLLTTDTQLSFEQAYKIYLIHWSIEVFFKESKQYLGLGKCQSQDFDAQIAATTLCMIQYNLLALPRRFIDYEMVGELFRASQKDTLKLMVAEQIWLIITEPIADLFKIFDIEVKSLIKNYSLKMRILQNT